MFGQFEQLMVELCGKDVVGFRNFLRVDPDMFCKVLDLIASNTITAIVRDMCEAIIEEFAQEVLQCPTTPEECKTIASRPLANVPCPRCNRWKACFNQVSLQCKLSVLQLQGLIFHHPIGIG